MAGRVDREIQGVQSPMQLNRISWQALPAAAYLASRARVGVQLKQSTPSNISLSPCMIGALALCHPSITTCPSLLGMQMVVQQLTVCVTSGA